MGTYCKYYKQKKQMSSDGGSTWEDVIPYEYREGSLYEECSHGCGYPIDYRWTISGEICVGHNTYVLETKQVTYDNGVTWNNTPIQRTGDIVQQSVSACDKKLSVTYSGNVTYDILCEIDTSISQSDLTASGSIDTVIGVSIGNCANEIEPLAFSGCTNLTDITIPSGITNIGESAFTDCWSLSSVTIPNNMTTIKNSVFYNCSGLTSIDIPSGVTSIGYNAFRNCNSLSELTIHSGLTSIGDRAFQDCSGLTSITVESATPPTLDISAFTNTNDCPIIVPCESVMQYKSASGWNKYASRITCENPLTYAKLYATYSGGTSYSAECDSNTTLTSGNTRPSGYYLNSMTSAVIGDCVTSIANNAFGGCYILTSITIPNSVTSIGAKAFSACTSLASIDIPSGVTSIGDSAFSGCSSLSSVTIPEGVTNIALWTFSTCTGLTSVTIPNSVTSISNSAFTQCHSLSNVTIGSGLTSISQEAFSACISLSALTIPSGVTSIGSQAFRYCRSLSSITINAISPPTIGSYALADTNNCPIYVPAESVETYKSASEWSNYSSRIQAIQ